MRISILVILLFSSLCAGAQNISASSGWTANVSSNQISDAGLDYGGTYQSSSNETYVSVSGLRYFGSYYVEVEKSEIDWDPRLSISVRRTGNGSGGWFSSITGGTNWLELKNSGQLFYYGGTGFATARLNVPVQYQIKGLSVLLPAKSYSVNIRYTVSD